MSLLSLTIKCWNHCFWRCLGITLVVIKNNSIRLVSSAIFCIGQPELLAVVRVRCLKGLPSSGSHHSSIEWVEQIIFVVCQLVAKNANILQNCFRNPRLEKVVYRGIIGIFGKMANKQHSGTNHLIVLLGGCVQHTLLLLLYKANTHISKNTRPITEFLIFLNVVLHCHIDTMAHHIFGQLFHFVNGRDTTVFVSQNLSAES